MFLKPNKTEKGFGLTELLVTIAMIMILSGVVFMDFNGAAKTLAIQRSAYKMAQDVRKTQGLMGTTDLKCKKFGAGDEFSVNYKYGYGISFSKGTASYFIFSDCDGNKNFDANDEVLETINFENHLAVSDIRIDASSTSSAVVVFTPPDPSIDITPNPTSGYVDIIIKVDTTSQTKDITINKGGMVGTN